jgi:predicted CDP-diglyceride synthetase/phosphatidate cytidylyltransferase
MGAASETDAQS